MRLGIAGIRGDAQQFGGAAEILREQLAFDVEQRQVVGRQRLAEFGRRREPLGARLAVARAGAASEAEHGEREHRLCGRRVSAASLYHSAGLLIVLRNAEAIGVKLAQERHRLRIGLVVDALRRERLNAVRK